MCVAIDIHFRWYVKPGAPSPLSNQYHLAARPPIPRFVAHHPSYWVHSHLLFDYEPSIGRLYPWPWIILQLARKFASNPTTAQSVSPYTQIPPPWDLSPKTLLNRAITTSYLSMGTPMGQLHLHPCKHCRCYSTSESILPAANSVPSCAWTAPPTDFSTTTLCIDPVPVFSLIMGSSMVLVVILSPIAYEHVSYANKVPTFWAKMDQLLHITKSIHPWPPGLPRIKTTPYLTLGRI